MSSPDLAPLDRLRAICLALPEVVEKTAWGEATYRVRDRMFASAANNHHGDGIVGVWCAMPPGGRDVLLQAAPARFYIPPYVGPKGWIGVRLDTPETDWDEVAAVLADAHAFIAANAPRRRASKA